MKIVVIGSINMDSTLKVEELPKKGETLMAKACYKAGGGKGANQAIAAKRLGADVFMIGCVGNDLVGDELISLLHKEDMDTSGINRVENASGNAVITTMNDGSNTIVVYGGANDDLNFEWVKKFEDIIAGCEYVILQLEIPIETVKKSIELAKSKNKKVILNPAPVREIPEGLYKNIDILTPNETELQKLTGCMDFKEGAKLLLDKGVKCVIVTLGDKGSYYIDRQNEYHINPIKVNAIDTTAAGDSYNAGIAVGLIEGMNMKYSLGFANVVGALTTTKQGAQKSLPYRCDVDNIIKNI